MTDAWTDSIYLTIEGMLKTNKKSAKERLTRLLSDYRWQLDANRKSNQRALKSILTQTDNLIKSINKLTQEDKEDLNILMRITITKADVINYDPEGDSNGIALLFGASQNFTTHDRTKITPEGRRMLFSKWIETLEDRNTGIGTLLYRLRRVNRSADALISLTPRKSHHAKVKKDSCILELWRIFQSHGGEFDTLKRQKKAFRAFVRAVNRRLPDELTLGTDGSIEKVIEKLQKAGHLHI